MVFKCVSFKHNTLNGLKFFRPCGHYFSLYTVKAIISLISLLPSPDPHAIPPQPSQVHTDPRLESRGSAMILLLIPGLTPMLEAEITLGLRPPPRSLSRSPLLVTSGSNQPEYASSTTPCYNAVSHSMSLIYCGVLQPTYRIAGAIAL